MESVKRHIAVSPCTNDPDISNLDRCATATRRRHQIAVTCVETQLRIHLSEQGVVECSVSMSTGQGESMAPATSGITESFLVLQYLTEAMPVGEFELVLAASSNDPGFSGIQYTGEWRAW